MKRGKKTFSLFLIAFATMFMITACGENTPPPDGGNGTGGDYINVVKDGTINIMLPNRDYPYENVAITSVAKSYMALNPKVKVNVQPQSASTYKDWLDSQFAGGNTNIEPDIVQSLLVSNAYATTKMIDYSDYLNKFNPYVEETNGGVATYWKDALEPDAYKMSQDRSGIYSLNLSSNMSFFFYNKTLWREAGLVDNNGVDKIPKTWAELEQFCEKIKTSNSGNTIPMSLPGNTYLGSAMNWLLNIYADQYFRDNADDYHAVAGDYCYDPDIDKDWALDVLDKDNDSFSKYTYNPLRFLQAIRDNETGTDNPRFKAMLANMMKVIPKYCQPSFSSNNYFQAEEEFWTGKAAMVYNTTDFFNTYKQLFAARPDAEKFEMGFFPTPPMTGEGESSPAANYVRSVGGAVGWYGTIKKDKKQNDLVTDFMMYWASPLGQNVFNASIKEQGAYVSGSTLVKNVEMPVEIYPAKDYPFPGLCHNNPMGAGFGTLTNPTGPAGQAFQLECQKLFDTSNLSTTKIDTYAKNMQKVLSQNIQKFLKDVGWRADALDDVTINPKM